MSKGTKTYMSRQVLISCGAHSVSGYAADSFVEIAPNAEGVTKEVGCDGEIARSMDPDETYKVKLTLLQTSNSNAFFQKYRDIDKKTGLGMFSILITDLKGGVLFQAAEAWVVQCATRTYGKATNAREWQLDTGDGTLMDAGV